MDVEERKKESELPMTSEEDLEQEEAVWVMVGMTMAWERLGRIDSLELQEQSYIVKK